LQYGEEGLPKSFSHEIYGRIDEWFGRRPQIQPPHVRDLLNPGDSNYVVEEEASNEDVEVVGENVAAGAPHCMHISQSETTEPANEVANARSGKGIASAFVRGSGGPHHIRGSPRSPPRQPQPRRFSPIILSSSDSGTSSGQRNPGSTGVRRRTSSAHATLAEATKATGEVMVAQMQAMVGATKETETNRLEVQFKLFAEKMQYQREKDQKLYEHGLLAAENARLAIVKQGELVQCLSQISKVLSVGLMVSGDPQAHYLNPAPMTTTQDAWSTEKQKEKDAGGTSGAKEVDIGEGIGRGSHAATTEAPNPLPSPSQPMYECGTLVGSLDLHK
jgi:hypothetical protein